MAQRICIDLCTGKGGGLTGMILCSSTCPSGGLYEVGPLRICLYLVANARTVRLVITGALLTEGIEGGGRGLLHPPPVYDGWGCPAVCP